MPIPLAQRCFDTSQFSHAILVTFELLQNFELLRVDPALALQIK